MTDLLQKLGIDWRLLIAQLVNFLVLFFVLRKFLYRPILGMLEQRRERIAKGLDTAKRAEAQVAELTFERKRLHDAAAAERVAMLEKAAADAEGLRKQRAASAEEEARAIIGRAQRDAERERVLMLAVVKKELGDLVLLVTQKATASALSAQEHEKINAKAAEELASASL